MIVVTGFSPEGRKEYGKRFLDTFDRYWPQDVELLVYTEEPTELPRGENRIIWEIPGFKQFMERWWRDPIANGRRECSKWRPNDRGKPYSFRFDAVKFSRQCFIPYHAAQGRAGLMCWLDADVVTYSRVPPGAIEGLLPAGHDLSYLGRPGNHSEIGFQLYRLPQASLMLQQFSGYFSSDRVFDLPQWHSAFVFDRARQESGIRAYNLTPNGRGHVWFQSPLGRYMDHTKGWRKKIGRSPERP